MSRSFAACGCASMRGSASRSSRPSTPNAAARSSSRWRRSAVASASSSARWDGWCESRKRLASVDEPAVRAPRRARAGGPARTCRPTGSTSRPIRARGERGARNDEVEAHVVTDDHRSPRELVERGEHGLDARARDHHRLRDAGEDGDLGRDGHARVHQRLERAEALAAADLDRADLGDRALARRSRPWSRGRPRRT